MKFLKWLAVPLFAVTAHAGLIASDDFNTAVTALNTAPAGWTSTNGTVDSLSNGFQGLPCVGNTGGCVDLDGSTSDAGVLTWNQLFNLNAGTTYTLNFMLAGSQRGDSNTIIATFAGTSLQIVLGSTAPYTNFSIPVTSAIALLGQTVSFANAGGDNLGALLDNVSVSDNITTPPPSGVPEPSTALLLMGAFAALPFIRRRR